MEYVFLSLHELESKSDSFLCEILYAHNAKKKSTFERQYLSCKNGPKTKTGSNHSGEHSR